MATLVFAACEFLASFLRESNLTLQDYDDLYMVFRDDEEAELSAHTKFLPLLLSDMTPG